MNGSVTPLALLCLCRILCVFPLLVISILSLLCRQTNRQAGFWGAVLGEQGGGGVIVEARILVVE